MDQEKTSWHLDKRVPLALIVAILLQTAGAIWYAGGMVERMNSLSEQFTELKEKMDRSAAVADRTTRLEAQMEYTVRTLGRIEQKLDRIAEKDRE